MAVAEGSTRRRFLLGSAATGVATVLSKEIVAATERTSKTAHNDRRYWLQQVQLVSEPVLKALSERSLRRTMPVEAVPGQEASRAVGTHLEALGRLLAGLAPWLELQSEDEEPAETALRNRYRDWARAGIASAVDPTSPDYMRFGDSSQTVVDSSFLALALLRAPKQLLHALDKTTQTRLVDALVKERTVLPGFNNWLLFSAINEAALKVVGYPWDRMRVDYALREHEGWYLGDGTYGDGPHFHWDFYNSFVIQPYLLQLMDTLGAEVAAWASQREPIQQRAQRYAAVQERLINSDGSYPVVGRSITYRCGAFHLLADISRRHLLPEEVTPSQVRCALTAVMQRTLGASETFSPSGWLQIGLAGHQPHLGETYISTGSLYLCSAAWLPLGLPTTDPFWATPAERWTSQKIWSGEDVHADHARDG